MAEKYTPPIENSPPQQDQVHSSSDRLESPDIAASLPTVNNREDNHKLQDAGDQEQLIAYIEQAIVEDSDLAIHRQPDGIAVEVKQLSADSVAASISAGVHIPVTRSFEHEAPEQVGQAPLQKWVEIAWPDSGNTQHLTINVRSSLAALRQLPAEQKAQAFDQVYEHHVKTNHQAAMLQESLIAMVEKDPQLDQEVLRTRFDAESSRLGLSETEVAVGHVVLDQFGQRQSKIQDLYDKYPNDLDLYKHQFKVDQPYGAIEISRLPFNIDIACHDVRDYAYLMQHEINVYNGLPVDNIVPDPDRFGTSSGLYSFGIFTFRNLTSTRRTSASTLAHETQHAKQLVLRDSLGIEAMIYESKNGQLWNELLSADTLETWQSCAKQIIKNIRFEYIDPQVKSEILAYSSEETVDSNALYQDLTKSKSEGGLYDYIADPTKAAFIKSKALALSKTLKDAEQMSAMQQFLQSYTQSVFGSDYQAAIAVGLEVISNLKQGLGYSQPQVLALLTHQELHNWPKLEHRLMRQMIIDGALDQNIFEAIRQDRRDSISSLQASAAQS